MSRKGDAALAKRKATEKPFTLEKWGLDVLLRQMTGSMEQEWWEKFVNWSSEEISIEVMAKAPEILIECCFDPENPSERIFSDANLPAMREIDRYEQMQWAQEVLALSGMFQKKDEDGEEDDDEREAIDQAKKPSSATPGSSEPSSRPGASA